MLDEHCKYLVIGLVFHQNMMASKLCQCPTDGFAACTCRSKEGAALFTTKLLQKGFILFNIMKVK